MQGIKDNEKHHEGYDNEPAHPLQRPKGIRSRRRTEFALATGLIVLAIVAVLGTPLRNTLFPFFFHAPSTPTAIPIPNDNLFFIQAAPWGNVTIDGRTLSPLPVPGKDAPIRLSRGLHQIIWHADPFQPVTCTVSVPEMLPNEPCPYESFANYHFRLITFSASLNNLLHNQRTTLVKQVQETLDTFTSTETVQPGEQYSYNTLSRSYLKTASTPLRATLHFYLDTVPPGTTCSILGYPCIFQGQDCHLFCTPIVPAQSATGATGATAALVKVWDAVVVTYSFWQYSTINGKIVAQDQPGTNSADAEDLLILQITWDSSGWHVAVLGKNPYPTLFPITTLACASAQNETSSGVFQVTGGDSSALVNWHFQAGKNNAAGCLATGIPTAQNATITPSDSLPPAHCLYRFGILLALNAAAHSYWPKMPVADAYEQKVAGEIGNS